jgi:hypothetical protein
MDVRCAMERVSSQHQLLRPKTTQPTTKLLGESIHGQNETLTHVLLPDSHASCVP